MSDPHNATWAAWTLHDMEKTAHSVGEWCPREAKQRIIQQAIDDAVAKAKADAMEEACRLLQAAHEAYEALGQTLEVTRKEYDARLAAANGTIRQLASAIAPGETVDHDTLVSLAVDGAEALEHLGAIQQTEAELAAANEEIERLRAIVDRLPTDHDGVPLIPIVDCAYHPDPTASDRQPSPEGTWTPNWEDGRGLVLGHNMVAFDGNWKYTDTGNGHDWRFIQKLTDCYSTREAAEIAKEATHE